MKIISYMFFTIIGVIALIVSALTGNLIFKGVAIFIAAGLILIAWTNFANTNKTIFLKEFPGILGGVAIMFLAF